MTVSLLQSPQAYAGLSTDAKPRSGVYAGATFEETDTGRLFRWDGVSWSASASPAGDATLADVVAEVRALRLAVQAAFSVPSLEGV